MYAQPKPNSNAEEECIHQIPETDITSQNHEQNNYSQCMEANDNKYKDNRKDIQYTPQKKNDNKSTQETSVEVISSISKIQHMSYIKQLQAREILKNKQMNSIKKKQKSTSRQQRKIDDYLPPMEKFKLIQLQKKAWMEHELKRKLEKEEKREMEGVTFHPQISQITQEIFKDKRRNVYEDNMMWKQKSEQQNKDRKVQMNQEEQIYSFKPNFYKKSLNMVKSGQFYNRLEENKQTKQTKINQIKRETTPSFKPSFPIKQTSSISPLRQRQQNSTTPPKNTTTLIEKLSQQKNTQPSRGVLDSFDFFEAMRRNYNLNDSNKIFETSTPRSNKISINNKIPANSAIWKMIERGTSSSGKPNSQPQDQEQLAQFGRTQEVVRMQEVVRTQEITAFSINDDDKLRNDRIAQLIRKLDEEIKTTIISDYAINQQSNYYNPENDNEYFSTINNMVITSNTEDNYMLNDSFGVDSPQDN